MTYTSFGLILDIIGVVLIGYSVAFARDASLAARSQTEWDFSSSVLKALVNERAAMRVGVTALFTGFVFQLIGAMDYPEPHERCWIAIWAVTALLAIIAFIYLYKGAAREYARLCEQAKQPPRD